MRRRKIDPAEALDQVIAWRKDPKAYAAAYARSAKDVRHVIHSAGPVTALQEAPRLAEWDSTAMLARTAARDYIRAAIRATAPSQAA
jgi:hypothetical protein